MDGFQLERKGRIAQITLQTDERNTLTSGHFQSLQDIFDQLEAEEEAQRAHVVLLRSGLEQVFSYGIKPELILNADLDGRREIFFSFFRMLARYADFGIPIVADINGPALASGATLATMADFSIAHEDRAKLSFSEVKVGFPIPEPLFQLLAMRIPANVAREMLILGKNVLARNLYRLEYTQAVYRSETNQKAELDKLLGRIMRIQPAVLAATLKAAKAGLRQSCEAFLESFDSTYASFLTRDEALSSLRQLLQDQQ